jgi:hypothetical protein
MLDEISLNWTTGWYWILTTKSEMKPVSNDAKKAETKEAKMATKTVGLVPHMTI